MLPPIVRYLLGLFSLLNVAYCLSLPPLNHYEVGINFGKYAFFIRAHSVYVRTGDTSYDGDDARWPQSFSPKKPYSGPGVVFLKYKEKVNKTLVWRLKEGKKFEELPGNLIKDERYLEFMPEEVRAGLLEQERLQKEHSSEARERSIFEGL